MNFTKNKILLALVILALCFSMLLAGCTDTQTQASDKERQEREEQAEKEERKACQKFVLFSPDKVYKDYSVKEELKKTMEILRSSAQGNCTIDLEYTYKFDPAPLEEHGFDVEYPEYETGYYKASLVTVPEGVDFDMLYELAVQDGMKTVSVQYYELHRVDA